jgi:hypothetical protein
VLLDRVDQGSLRSMSLKLLDDQLTMLQGLLAVPFVLHSQPTAVFEPDGQSVEKQASVAQQRYAEIFRDVENIINDHSESIQAYVSTTHRAMASLTTSLSRTPKGWQTGPIEAQAPRSVSRPIFHTSGTS